MHITTKLIILENIVLLALANILIISGTPLLLSYETHKTLHILGAVFLLGNIIITGVWMFYAIKTKNDAVIKFSAKLTNWMDVFFTGPGAILLITNGLMLSSNWGEGVAWFNTSWILSAFILFIASGVIWFYLIYIQEKFIQVTNNPNGNYYKAIMPYAKQWFIWGSIAIVLPLMSLIIMVTKVGYL